MKNSSSKRHARPTSALLFTCEHASNRIPAIVRHLFIGQSRLLSSHRGWDDGALTTAKYLATRLNAPLIAGKFSRLAIDLNRSPRPQKIFSAITLGASPEMKQSLLNRVYSPFRQTSLNKIVAFHRSGKIVHHFSIHSFTPALNGKIRNCEIGILYDPMRPQEKRLAQVLKTELSTNLPLVRVRMNYPYRGTADGHTTDLRKRFPNSIYTGLEIELNQAWLQAIRRSAASQRQAYLSLTKAIKTAVETT